MDGWSNFLPSAEDTLSPLCNGLHGMMRMSEEGQDVPIPSSTEFSRKSHDSGFSDSDCGTVIAKTGGKPSKKKRLSLSISSISGSEDGEKMSFPQHSSTPKSKNTESFCTESPIRKEWTCPVNLWLKEIRYWCDPECMSTLHNKPIIAETSEKVTTNTSIALNSIRDLNRQILVIREKLNLLFRKFNHNNIKETGELLGKIIKMMEKMLLAFNVNIYCEFDCSGLLLAYNNLNSGEVNDAIHLVAIVKRIIRMFTKKSEQLLLKYIKILVDLLDTERSPSSLAIVLSAISSLDMAVPLLSFLLTSSSAISSIVMVLIDSNSPAVRTVSLNILATVCCTPASIEQLEESGCLEVLCEILSSTKRGEAEQCAAMSLLAQVTGPWLDVTIQGIQEHMDVLIPSITRIVNNKPSTEMLMMCASSLANISGLEIESVHQLVRCNSVISLLNAVRVLGSKASVFIKEQTATLLANMAKVNGVLAYLRLNRTIPALLCFLQPINSLLHTESERDATFRLQHKAIIALSRLCSDSDAANQVVEFNGVSRIVALCLCERERYYNNGVLVACLVALRKIADHCGMEVLEALNAHELVEQNLMESFLIYSSNLPK